MVEPLFPAQDFISKDKVFYFIFSWIKMQFGPYDLWIKAQAVSDDITSMWSTGAKCIGGILWESYDQMEINICFVTVLNSALLFQFHTDTSLNILIVIIRESVW